LAGSARLTAPREYLYIGQVHTFHTFADLKSLLEHSDDGDIRRYLQGRFIFVDPKGRKHKEGMETPGGMTERLIKQREIAA
jgi:hypothetical protein